ncbi:N-6 DNA methylase [Chitinophaga agri]|uniref:site-specific DNA-methyltransferase (adenine-specific) n=2 Tax=Chitinophaga agri TaxID=2703787 RepID=A0A6B9ZNN4_9BACT|nr:N-6 DNA methylase [Chitinophaga agri]
MSQSTNDIVSKLWNLCNILKDDGVTYHQYVTELTYLIFLKMAKETGFESQIPVGNRWDAILEQEDENRLETYKASLESLKSSSSRLVSAIFDEAQTFIKKHRSFVILTNEINKLEWYKNEREELGNIYEGLLEKNASEKKSGAGQYFTSRPLINCLVDLMKPSIDDIIQDPAAGTAGFLVAASGHIKRNTDVGKFTNKEVKKFNHGTFYGMEHVHDTQRLALMNMALHGISKGSMGVSVLYGDTLSSDGLKLPKATLVLSNPPFGNKKGGGLPERPDFSFPTSNKQLCFLQHIYLGLECGGRAAVVVPDNVLIESNTGRLIRTELMDKCRLHTILKLPPGIFYAQGVKTSVLFFTRGKLDVGNTKETWIYDLRSNMPLFNKSTLLEESYFEDFKKAYGDDPWASPEALQKRIDTGLQGRFRRFDRETIKLRNDNLNISWLSDESERSSTEISPLIMIEGIQTELLAALEDIQTLISDLTD